MNVRQSRIGWAVGKVFDAIQVLVYTLTFIAAINYLFYDKSSIAIAYVIVLAMVSSGCLALDYIRQNYGNC